MKKMRNLMWVIMALTMSLVLCIPAFAAEAVPTISLKDGEVGDKWMVGDFLIEIIDAETFESNARGGYIFQNEVYTSAVDSSFGWNCGSDPVLSLSVDCALSKTPVKYAFHAGSIASIEDTLNAGSARFWTITNKNPNNQYATVNYSFSPDSYGEQMRVSFSAREGN